MCYGSDMSEKLDIKLDRKHVQTLLDMHIMALIPHWQRDEAQEALADALRDALDGEPGKHTEDA